MAPQAIYRDGRSPSQRVQDRLKNSCAQDDVRTETQPTRTVTSIHFAGQQAASPNHPLQKGKDILRSFGPDAKRRP
jgi:hypothetical protein